MARTAGGNLKEAPNDKQGGYLLELDIPYVYYQQGEKRSGKLIATGNIRLLSTHARVLANHIRQEKNFLAHIDPDGHGESYLTPEPTLISWWYLIKLVIIVALGVLLIRFFDHFMMVFFLLVYYPDLITSNFSAFYPEGLVKWLTPEKETARPQVQSKIIESLTLPEEIIVKEKLKG